MAIKTKIKRKTTSAKELFEELLAKVSRMDDRLASIEGELVLNRNMMVRHGTLIEEVNVRCIQTLGLKCAELAGEKEG
jgi:hypothetical protein